MAFDPKKILRGFYRAKGHFSANLNGENFRVDPYHFAFWRAASNGTWEPGTFDVLASACESDRDVLDIGAWIGPTALFCSRRAHHVYAFEPDPVAFRYLNWNVDLNGIGNISPLPVALSDRDGIARMGSFGDNRGDSQTSLLNPEDKTTGIDAVTMSWDTLGRQIDLERIRFVKIDIEGGEFNLLPLMAEFLERHRPALFLSCHAPYLSEEKRSAAMSLISEATGCYDRLTDHNLAPLRRDALLSAEAAKGFGAFLLTG
ncbi:methyltransferase, FkbM family [Thalassovita gelatinovora]|uniref:Methyltransferase, FkbM family n=1 Tax=Thalassovita gelatinovora TaxID=53501 RepID=A0A0P1F6Z8_THAGE|nr:FkbM family methyltransferase [Thalassovita gelatinovora]QIZ79215.1 FkbM family methyltransferase [Thalassovita gelatinovora]CUH63711.1 methyltransferase, FkbM family [Thalassovita gelatinovora]SER02126.1 methyltransferase, FkbM family [Thalassovita gelatinovora]